MDIEARIEPHAREQAASMADASLKQAIDETLANARRAGATAVGIEIGDDASIRIADDGHGIAYPEVLLEFGGSRWPEGTPGETPEGVGFHALARWNPTVTSRTAGEWPVTWRTSLRREHFQDGAKAEVVCDQEAPRPHGTVVTFGGVEGADADDRAARVELVRRAVTFYPVPVTIDGAPAEQRSYLGTHAWTEETDGLRVGVVTERWRQKLEGSVNVHGRTVAAGMPRIRDLDGRVWTAQADVTGAAGIDLALPARSDIVDNASAERMREAARHAIYQAMAAAGRPAARWVAEDAAAMGVTLPAPPARLRRWRPDTADTAGSEGGEPTAVGNHTIVVGEEIGASDGQVLQRAAAGTALGNELREAAPILEGYDWYDRLPRITRMRIEAIDGDCVFVRDTEQERDGPEPPARCDEIAVTVTIRTADGKTREERLATDVAFWDTEEDGSQPQEMAVTVTRTSPATRNELAGLITAGFFRPDEEGTETRDEQRRQFARDATALAAQVLESPGAALRHLLETAARRHLLTELGGTQWAAVAVDGRTGAVTVEVTEHETSRTGGRAAAKTGAAGATPERAERSGMSAFIARTVRSRWWQRTLGLEPDRRVTRVSATVRRMDVPEEYDSPAVAISEADAEASGAEPGATLTLAEDETHAEALGGRAPQASIEDIREGRRGEVLLLCRWWIREVGPDGSPWPAYRMNRDRLLQ